MPFGPLRLGEFELGPQGLGQLGAKDLGQLGPRRLGEFEIGPQGFGDIGPGPLGDAAVRDAARAAPAKGGRGPGAGGGPPIAPRDPPANAALQAPQPVASLSAKGKGIAGLTDPIQAYEMRRKQSVREQIAKRKAAADAR